MPGKRSDHYLCRCQAIFYPPSQKFPLMLMWGRAEGLACADLVARTPIGASENSSCRKIVSCDSFPLVLDSRKTDNLKMFMKPSHVKLHFIKLNEDQIWPKQLVEKKSSVFISLLKEDEQTFFHIDSALHANPAILFGS